MLTQTEAFRRDVGYNKPLATKDERKAAYVASIVHSINADRGQGVEFFGQCNCSALHSA